MKATYPPVEEGTEESQHDSISELEDEDSFSPEATSANNEILALANIISDLLQQSHENRLILKEVGVELLSQSIVLNALYKENSELDAEIKQVGTKLQTLSNPATFLKESIEKIQEQARILIKARKSQTEGNSIIGSKNLSRRAIALILLGQTCFVATVTALAINQFPPKASVKTEQQLYSVFQRVDGLYKAKFGNKIPKK